MNNKKFVGLSIIAFLASIAGIVVSFLTLREDIISTAKTLFEFFPTRYGVTPAVNWEGAIILAVFTSVLQIVSASVAFSPKYGGWMRFGAFLTLVASAWFDNWTDVVFRSGYLTGDTKIATVSTLAFYTFGSEITQSLSWLVFLNIWRVAISDVMWGTAKLIEGFNSISGEWSRFKSAAQRQERKERGLEDTTNRQPSTSQSQAQPASRQASEYKPQTQMQNSQRAEPQYHPVGYYQGKVSPPQDVPEFIKQQMAKNRKQ